MIQAIVFLPLLGFLLAGGASLLVHRPARRVEAWAAQDHGAHGHGAGGHHGSAHGDHASLVPSGEPGAAHEEAHHHVEPSPHAPATVRFAEVASTALLFVAAALSWVVFARVGLGHAEPYKAVLGTWFASGDMRVEWALRVDTLTAVMLVVVNSVSALVHLYSVGYMSEDPHRPRFFAYLSLFTFAMLMLVTADNLVQMFFGWEGVGLASYLLIGFWYERASARAAAIKAFVVNRVGDFGFALGIFLVFHLFGTVAFDEIFAQVPAKADATYRVLWGHGHALTIAALLLFMGAMGKSAQFLLHTWLPDAMEGPTPVSALIHAATMVTAGVFMVARLTPLFDAAPAALTVVAGVGAITAFFAATVGLVQTDIKRVIAYSTCSQLGYMFVALGVGAPAAAVFHLFTHAFFKALLFLGAGSVIHAMHHEQDMRNMGGLARKIPYTCAAMIIGTLALTAVPFFAGGYSKDAIIEAAYASGSPARSFAFLLTVIAAGLTAFYSWRLIFLTFFGPTRAAPEVYAHAHESPPTMMVPLALLSVGAVASGFAFEGFFLGHHYAEFWKGALPVSEVVEGLHSVPTWVKVAPILVMALGALLSVKFYIVTPTAPARLAADQPLLYNYLLHKWYFDEVYDALIVRPIVRLGRFLWKRGDAGLIDHFGPDGIARGVLEGSRGAVRVQTGYVYHYAFAMLIGVAGLVTWYLFRGGA